MNKGKLIVFSAPSGSGKTTIVKHLLGKEDLNLEFSISAASRDPRGEEVNGKDYYFLSLQEFKNKIKNEMFLPSHFFQNSFLYNLFKFPHR